MQGTVWISLVSSLKALRSDLRIFEPPVATSSKARSAPSSVLAPFVAMPFATRCSTFSPHTFAVQETHLLFLWSNAPVLLDDPQLCWGQSNPARAFAQSRFRRAPLSSFAEISKAKEAKAT